MPLVNFDRGFSEDNYCPCCQCSHCMAIKAYQDRKSTYVPPEPIYKVVRKIEFPSDKDLRDYED